MRDTKEIMRDSEKWLVNVEIESKQTEKLLEKSLIKFEREKINLTNGSLIHLDKLLKKVNYHYLVEERVAPFELSHRCSVESIEFKHLKSGVFSALFLALTTALLTLVGWFSLATLKRPIEWGFNSIELFGLNLNRNIESALSWIGSLLGGESSSLLGVIVVGVSALLLSYLVYAVRIFFKKRGNLKKAIDKSEEVASYVEQKNISRLELIAIDEHLEKLIPLVKSYDILLKEQNSKLERVLHLEGELPKSNQYHFKSQQIMKESATLMRRVEELVFTAITKNHKLNEASVHALMRAEAIYEGHTSKLYS